VALEANVSDFDQSSKIVAFLQQRLKHHTFRSESLSCQDRLHKRRAETRHQCVTLCIVLHRRVVTTVCNVPPHKLW